MSDYRLPGKSVSWQWFTAALTRMPTKSAANSARYRNGNSRSWKSFLRAAPLSIAEAIAGSVETAFSDAFFSGSFWKVVAAWPRL